MALTFKKPSTHRLAIDGRGHIPYKIAGYNEFKKIVNDILDKDEDNFFLNEYPHHVDDVPHIYSLGFDWNLSDAAIYSNAPKRETALLILLPGMKKVVRSIFM